MHSVILAGGAGTRFWPKSRRQRPKQLLHLINSQSLFAQTAQRLGKALGSDKLYVVASADIISSIKAEGDHIPAANYIVEPSSRNTAPAIALTAFVLRKRFGDGLMGVFPADHLIRKQKQFRSALKLAQKKAAEGPNLVTLGIQPTRPATAYGYVQFSRETDGDVHRVVRFTEKPDLDTAREFLESGDYLWNGGIFIWQISTILEKLAQHLPTTYNKLASIEQFIDTPKFEQQLARVWPDVDAISIDYGVLENADDLFTVEAQFDWNDLGSWRTLYDVLPKDRSMNVTQGDVTTLDTHNSLIVSEGPFTAVIGADNLIVVAMDDATIVLPRSESDRVQEIVQWLKSSRREELL
ncbi:MAG: mannose-1-phosphate guanylyltransferase [Candidatus Marinimicrobia bacterium]|nr:mannose-1-phosphate guanylyltransferase [Candidatus Neomarinimicrobiota bacterium]